MGVQLLEALVEAVDGQEERLRDPRCGSRRACRGPRRPPTSGRSAGRRSRTSGPSVPRSRRKRPSVFSTFRPRAPAAWAFAQLVGLDLRVAGLRRARVRRLGERQEPARVRRLELAQARGEAGAGAAGEVHHRADVPAVHHRQQLGWRREHLARRRRRHGARCGRKRQVRVDVDDRVARARHRCLRHAQHAARLELADVQRLRRAAGRCGAERRPPARLRVPVTVARRARRERGAHAANPLPPAPAAPTPVRSRMRVSRDRCPPRPAQPRCATEFVPPNRDPTPAPEMRWCTTSHVDGHVLRGESGRAWWDVRVSRVRRRAGIARLRRDHDRHDCRVVLQRSAREREDVVEERGGQRGSVAARRARRWRRPAAAPRIRRRREKSPR